MNLVAVGEESAGQVGDIGFAAAPGRIDVLKTESDVHGKFLPQADRRGDAVKSTASILALWRR